MNLISKAQKTLKKRIQKKKNIEIRYLGENILKAETAPIFVSSIVKNHFGKI